jgi:hypothetical protein
LNKAFTIFLVFVAGTSFSQHATILLRDSLKVSTELNSISENQLKTKAGTFGLAEIYSVRIKPTESKEQNPALVHQLLNAGIIVYIGEMKLEAESVSSDATVAKPVRSQEPVKTENKNQAWQEDDSKASFGIGVGQDYGGIGGRFTYVPTPHLGIYGSGGFALAGFGYNIGLLLRMQPAKKVVPTANLMYGYNAVIVVQGASQFNKLYYGPSLGFGFISKNRNDLRNYWHFELLIPFRPSEFERDLNVLKKNPIITGLQDPLPITISIGYHFSF